MTAAVEKRMPAVVVNQEGRGMIEEGPGRFIFEERTGRSSCGKLSRCAKATPFLLSRQKGVD